MGARQALKKRATFTGDPVIDFFVEDKYGSRIEGYTADGPLLSFGVTPKLKL